MVKAKTAPKTKNGKKTKATKNEKCRIGRPFGAFVAVGIGLVLVLTFATAIYGLVNQATHLSALPAPEVSEGMRGELGIDKNINEENIDNYLGRSDSVYRDMRMLVDDADYEAIDGDSYLSGIVDGFEVVPLPYIIKPTNLPEAVGKPYSGRTLFRTNADGTYTANYEESMQIIEDLFPKDKNIFLMCGGGGYAGMMKKFLVAEGWDENKIYNVGGYWYYNGNHKVEIKNGDTYAFWKLKYHMIDFSGLTRKA